MSFSQYSDVAPDMIKTVQVVLRREMVWDGAQWVAQDTGRYRVLAVNDTEAQAGPSDNDEQRFGNLADIVSVLAGTSITAAELVTWMGELFTEAETRILP